MFEDLTPAEQMTHAESAANWHKRETGHRVRWAQVPAWFCETDDCEATFPPRENPTND